MSDSQTNNEVSLQFLRRTSVKLRQFSRLLDDMMTQEIEALRVKALFSQVNRTREACLAQNFDTTAKLLNQLLKQLKLSEGALETQKPLLKRLSTRLMEHSQKFELGVRPEKPKLAPIKVEESPQPEVESEPETTPANQINLKEETQAELETQLEQPSETLEVAEDNEEATESLVLLDKGGLIFVNTDERYQELALQFQSLGIQVFQTTTVNEAKVQAEKLSGSIIVAPLSLAESNQQLEDSDTESSRIPLIYTAEEDTQEERLQALRSGGTAYLVEPLSLSGLIAAVESQYDMFADSPYRVLVMEDSKAQARYYEKVLCKGHFDVRIVNDPRVLLEALRGFEPETILMDMQMPTCTGIELTRIIRQMPRYSDLPIIFLSAEENQQKQNQALLSGGTSFIVKPVEKTQLMFLAELYTKRHRRLSPQIGENPDTGLMYIAPFKQRISAEVSRTSRGGHSLALAIIQLDQAEELFKGANFSAVNVAIQQLAMLLKKRLRKSDIIGHLESGQLGVILTTGKQQDWANIVDKIRLQFAELPFHLKHHDNPLSVSIGVSILDQDWDAHRWYESAKTQLNLALSEGGDRLQVESHRNN